MLWKFKTSASLAEVFTKIGLQNMLDITAHDVQVLLGFVATGAQR